MSQLPPPDAIEPATAAIVQKKLRANNSNCSVVDVSASCTGWLIGVDLASRVIVTSDQQEKILVLASALTSREVPFQIVQHRAIFGDGAGGILIEKASDNEASYIYGSEFLGLGQYSDVIYWPARWSVHPETVMKKFSGYFYMGKKELLFQLLRRHVKIMLNKLWKKTGFKADDVDFAIIHQPSEPLFRIAVETSGIAPDKVAYNFNRYGNTVSAELPITLDESIEKGRIERGDLVLLITYGAGITVGAMLLRY